MSKRRRKKQTRSLQGIIIALIVIVGGWLISGGQPSDISNFIQNISQNTLNHTKNVSSNDELAKLNYHSGDQSFIYVNHNKANLDPAKWKINEVRYANLDSLNRTSRGNLAYLESRNLASDENRVRQYVEPTAWHQKFVDRQPIINRGHLIAYSISKGISSDGRYNPRDSSGDQNNPKNLFTQTAFSNQRVQTIYEQKIRDSLKAGKRVIFYSKPIFRDNELMARGIHLEALSTDKSLNFNVYLFNVQPNVKFDYATGRSTIDRSMKVPEP
ncbi:DNA/RNA non-specific endonuclease [Lentilactobacillus diolivorans]|uniref:DNA RNA non-specific endonuclease n=2 Tax=Lentilactobacillus diolivorans TaxID=179838 RepID=A0A0R1SFE8_9LACO|nr:DNA/RNA non-specific endonuclease [Lentilactobacillus diolivorans]KRL68007.1 DNA RNA non-specific endonuclease [Lentilactobacillus diolivorans DSM 14421]GEP24817.1 DNA nuclease [Lentilactobacillus diolivorans]